MVLAILIVLLGSAFIAARATESDSFCGNSCHEMAPYRDTWKASTHAAVDCVQCHIPPGVFNFVRTKFFALREVWVHVTGQVKAPIAVTRKIPNEVCVGCHASSNIPVNIHLKTTTFSHRNHVKVPYCIDCHSQVVHEPIPGRPYLPPQSMDACFVCHDGKSQPNDCVYCHEAPHADRGACDGCHSLGSWDSNFKHPEPLVGKHTTFACERCHTQASATGFGPADGCLNCHDPAHPLHMGNLDLKVCSDCHVITHWSPTTFKHPTSGCTDCHEPGPLHQGLTACQDCHTLGGSWNPTFVHQQVGEHIPRGEVSLQCSDCHQITYAKATCNPCHAAGGPTGG